MSEEIKRPKVVIELFGVSAEAEADFIHKKDFKIENVTITDPELAKRLKLMADCYDLPVEFLINDILMAWCFPETMAYKIVESTVH